MQLRLFVLLPLFLTLAAPELPAQEKPTYELGPDSKPQEKAVSNAVFGGPEFAYLYVASVDKVYRRKTRSPGEPYFLRAKPR